MAYTERFVTDAASGGDGNDNLGIGLSNATYDHTGNGEGERHLSLSSGFSSYTFVSGDKIYLSGAAGGITVPALYEIASKVDNDAVLLTADGGLTADSTADVDSSAGPWTLAEAFTNGTTADRVNIQSDSGYSLGADVVDGVGTLNQLLCFRGYNSTIGDRENSGWNANGSLNTTNYPVITLTGTLTFGGSVAKFVLFQNLVFTGSINGILVGEASPDDIYTVECSFTNTANNSAAGAFRGDNDCVHINSDFECSGAAHSIVLDGDARSTYIGCRILGLEDAQPLCQLNDGSVTDCLLRGGSGANGIGINHVAAFLGGNVIKNNTFYNLDTDIQFPNSAPQNVIVLINNHATDSTKWIDSLRQPTEDVVVLEINSRTRDVTTPRTGVGDGTNIGEVTTDTGGASTDYTNAGSDDFTLISTAPGKATGMRQYMDIGAYQRQEPSGGGGGGKQAGSGGGQAG